MPETEERPAGGEEDGRCSPMWKLVRGEEDGYGKEDRGAAGTKSVGG